jgi:4-hydroxyphenylacetate 3-monooxygenase
MRSGGDYLAAISDQREVYLDGRRVEDVTTDPAFRGAVSSIAALYDAAVGEGADDLQARGDGGTPVNSSFLIPRSRADLEMRRRGSRRWARETFGLMGRSPDHVASFLSGFAGGAEVFARGGREFAENVRSFHRRAAEEDLYVSYVIVPPQIDRSKPAHQQADPHLYAGVKEERDDGIVIAGAQMMGTGAAISDWIFLSSIVPLRPGDENYAISLVLPTGSPGVKIVSRRSYAQAASSIFDYPLASRFDETDSLVVFDDVFVPWEQVFVYRDLDLVQAQWWETGAHILGNFQAQLRFATKVEFLTGIAHRVVSMNGLDRLPPVQAMLGDIGAAATMVSAMVLAAEARSEPDVQGTWLPGAADVFAATTLQFDLYARLLREVRELCGGGLIQLPASDRDFQADDVRALLERYVQSPGVAAEERVKLMKLAWDILGSEFAGRHEQYEMFYAGPPFAVKTRMFRHYDFGAAAGLVEDALAGYDLEGLVRTASPDA